MGHNYCKQTQPVSVFLTQCKYVDPCHNDLTFITTIQHSQIHICVTHPLQRSSLTHERATKELFCDANVYYLIFVYASIALYM